MVVGEGQKFASALIVPSYARLKDWCTQNGISAGSNKEIINNQKVIQVVEEEVKRLNQNFGHIEQIKKFELMPDEWTTLGGELTPTLKLKRKFILNKYKSLVDKIYSN